MEKFLNAIIILSLLFWIYTFIVLLFRHSEDSQPFPMRSFAMIIIHFVYLFIKMGGMWL